MNDLIERQAAIEAATDKFGICIFRERLLSIPPAQPEKKTGTWLIRKWGDDAKCSNCGRYFSDAYDMDNYDQYCRHCGTYMKGVEQNEVCDKKSRA